MPAFPAVSILKDEAALQQYILLTLGAPQLKVELVQEDLEEAIEEAKRWFASKKGVTRQAPINLSSGQSEYPLPDDVNVVMDFAFPGRYTDFARFIDPLHLIDGSIPYNMFPAPAAGGLFSSYVQAVGYLDSAQRITGNEPEWWQEGRTLYILPRGLNAVAGTGIITYKTNTFNITELSERDHEFIKKYALAWARAKLGTVWRKYTSGFPGAQGTVNLNGEALYAEAQAAMAALSDEISESGYPMGFVVG